MRSLHTSISISRWDRLVGTKYTIGDLMYRSRGWFMAGRKAIVGGLDHLKSVYKEHIGHDLVDVHGLLPVALHKVSSLQCSISAS